MKNKSAKSIVYKYFLECGLVLVIMLAILIAMFFDFNIYIYLATLLVFNVIGKMTITILANANFLPILSHDLDADKFNEVIHFKKFVKSNITYRILASYCLGDYKTTIYICSEKIKNNKIKNPYFYLVELARVYFELGDTNNLKFICDKLTLVMSSRNKMKQKDSIMNFFKSYLKGNFNECIEITNNIYVASKQTNFEEINKDFYRAIIYYRSGDMTQSKILFEEIIQKAPKMNFAKISQKYFEAIENSAGIGVSFSDMLQPQSDEL